MEKMALVDTEDRGYRRHTDSQAIVKSRILLL